MRGSAIVIAGVLTAGIGTLPASACDPAVPTAMLGLGVCALESVDEGVQARGCGVAAPGTWTISAPPVAKTLRGTSGGTLGGAAVDVLLSDGASLWLGVSERRGCRLRPGGLVRYDWRRGAVHAFRGTDTGPCGFVVQDLLLRDDTLWVATDLGVSRLRLSPDDWDEWTHYAVSADGGALEEATCASLLTVVADAAATAGGGEIGAWLAEFRPRFVRRLGARERPPRRGTAPASSPARRRNEEAVGPAGRAGVGRGDLGNARRGPGRP